MKKINLTLVAILLWQICSAQLRVYSAYNFQGASGTCVSKIIYTGSSIPNGLNNSIKSIQLSQGFMATLAENEDGTGERFTYMATQSAINVNLALVLQNKISFIRVLKLPNTPVRKKGAGVITEADEIAANTSWYYDWGSMDSSTLTSEYVPMMWSGGTASQLRIDSVIRDSLTHYLAFNEPNHASQANMFVRNAIPIYKKMLRAGTRMGSPVGTEEAYRTWVDSFATEASKQKLQIDFICVHWYDWGNWLSTSNTNPTATQVLNRFKAYIDDVWDLYKKPIWVTEFNANVNRSAAVNQAFFELAIPWLDSDPRIERYAPFFEDHFPLLDANGNLTPMGTMYNAQQSTLAYPQNIVDSRPVFPEVVLAGFNTTGLNTTTSNSISSPLAPTTLDARITATQSLTAGSGNTGSFSLAGFWGGLSWSNSTAAVGISENKFISFKLQAATGKTVNYSLIDTVNIRINTNGPNQYQFQYQINNGSFVNIATRSIATVTALRTDKLSPIDLSSISALQNVPSTSTVTFRIIPYGATTTNSFAIGDGTSNSTNDLAIKGYLLEDTATVLVTPGNALNFDGTDDYISIADANAIDLTTNYTLEAWIRPTNFSTNAGIISKSQTNTSAGYYLGLSNSSPFTGLSFDGLQTANGILEAGKWYHIAAVNNGGTRTLYVNGIATPLTGTVISTAINTQALTIGVHNLQTPRYFSGSIDEVRIWNIAKQESEIKEFMFNTISASTNNLVKYFNFDNGIAGGTNTGLNILQELTSNPNNGTLTNMALTGATSNWVESYAMIIPEAKQESSKTTTGFTANWLPPSISNLQNVDHYLLDVSTNSNFSSFVPGYNAAIINGTSQNITGLTPNTTYYYRVRANKTAVSNQGGFSETITVIPLSTDANLSALTLSQGSLSPIFESNTTAYSVTYQNNIANITVTPTKSNTNATIQININGGIYASINSGTASSNLALNVGNNVINILVTAEDLSTKMYSITITREVNTWTGATSVAYNTASNWTGNVVPTINDDILIPDVSAASNRYPQITGIGNAEWKSFAKNITINAGASLTVTNNSDFTRYGIFIISGNIINNGTFTVTSRSVIDVNGATIEFAGSTLQTIAANTFAGNTVYNLRINNPSGVVLNGALTVNGTLTPTTGTFTTNNNLTLSSIITRTAGVAAGSGVIVGNVTVQRFVPARRAFRFLAHPFTNNLSISELTDNIDITGSGGSPFTNTITNSSSAFEYNNNNVISTLSQGWTPLTATSTLNALRGYRILMRGTKGQGLNGQTYTASSVTLNWSGTLNQGNQVATLAYNGVNKDYSLVGNPYASPIDLSLVTLGSNVNANFSVWNTTAGTRGAYVTQPFSNSYILPSGAAFFAQSIANTNNTITFTEASKPTTGSPNSIFSTSNTNEFLTLEVNDSTGNYADKLDFIFNNNLYTTKYDALWDAIKMINPDVNFYSICNDSILLAIDRRPNMFSSIPLGFTAPIGNYKIMVKNLPSLTGSNYYLKDNYLLTTTLLSKSTTININITDDAASSGNNRFELTTNNTTILPVTFISINGNRQIDGINLLWKVANEKNLDKYEIEKSENGNIFTKIASIKAIAIGSYTWLDKSKNNGSCYYRIKAVNSDGSFEYSQVINIEATNKADFSIKISPNPLNDLLNLHYFGLNETDYSSIVIYDNNGKQLTAINIGKVKTGQYNMNIKSLLKGSYIIQLHNGSRKLSKKIIKE